MIFGVWTYTLGFWTCILGSWTYIFGSELIFWVSELILRVFWSGRVGPGGSGGSAGRPGRDSSAFGEKPALGIRTRKKITIDYIIEF